MSRHVQVDDRAFQKAYASYLGRLVGKVGVATLRYGESVVVFARSHIRSESGELAGSLKVEDHLQEIPPHVIVGAFETEQVSYRHAAETEFGTSVEAPHPYFRPALEEAKRDFRI